MFLMCLVPWLVDEGAVYMVARFTISLAQRATSLVVAEFCRLLRPSFKH